MFQVYVEKLKEDVVNVADQSCTSGRKKRKPYTRYQNTILEQEFGSMTYITRQKRWEIATRLHLTERQVGY